MEQETGPSWRRIGRALALHALGREKEAEAALAELVEKHQRTAALQIAEVYAFQGNHDEAFDWLDRAFEQRDAGLFLMGARRCFPASRPIHGTACCSTGWVCRVDARPVRGPPEPMGLDRGGAIAVPCATHGAETTEDPGPLRDPA